VLNPTFRLTADKIEKPQMQRRKNVRLRLLGLKIWKTHPGEFPKGDGALSSEGLSMIFQAGLLALFRSDGVFGFFIEMGLHSGGDRAGFPPASLFSRSNSGHLKAMAKIISVIEEATLSRGSARVNNFPRIGTDATDRRGLNPCRSVGNFRQV
jgi:hypothetical protein